MPAKNTFRFSAPLERSDNKLWGAHLRIPAEIFRKLSTGKSQRILCTLADGPTFHCAMLPFRKGVRVISINKKIRDTLRLDFGTMITVALQSDTSAYGLPVPDELKELFRQDPKGRKMFHSLTPGKQRTLLYIIGAAKTSDKRLARAVTILRHITKNEGAIHYKELQYEMKGPRQQHPSH